MLSFNSLLTSVGLDPVTARLVRHKHERRYQRLLNQDAIRCEPRFEQYQSGQSNPRVIAMIKSASLISAFVVDPAGGAHADDVAKTILSAILQPCGRKTARSRR
jgi:hypothetical protein